MNYPKNNIIPHRGYYVSTREKCLFFINGVETNKLETKFPNISKLLHTHVVPDIILVKNDQNEDVLFHTHYNDRLKISRILNKNFKKLNNDVRKQKNEKLKELLEEVF